MTKEYFTNIYKEWIISENPTLLNLVFMLYGQPMMSVLYKKIKFNPNSSLYRLEKDEDNKEEFYTINKIDTAKSWNKLKQLPGSFYYTDIEGTNLIFFDDFFLDWDYGISLYCKDYNKIPDVFLNSLEFFEEVPTIKVCSGITNAGMQLMESEIKKVIFEDIKENYNNDLPNDKIIDFLRKKDESGLVILNGTPGTGKTTYIRSLIYTLKDIDFVFIDINDFYKICDNKQYLGNLKDSILIIEDCEALIKDRNTSQFSQNISDLLQITDGLLGDGLNIKIICTFNTNVTNIDKALLRKGRIKLLYEFKELTEDKAKSLYSKLNIPYNQKERVLCDIFNKQNTGAEKPQINKIGF